jgi:crotonobetainyl-CoA:carnitine CoA-transferase CaiB-like acyl-CoA transferase
MTDSVSQGALAGVRVVEFGEGIAAPFGARLLGDLGADVIKVERPGGDPMRREGPSAPGNSGHSALFEYLNWNKRSVVVDPAADAGRDALHRLLEGADILLHGFGPGTLDEAWGCDPAALQARHPHLMVVAVSEFGWQGPYAHWHGSDLVMQAMGGIMSFSGLRDREPLKPGLRQSYYCAGINAAYVAMAGYLATRRNGKGSVADLAIMEVVASELVSVLPAYSLLGVINARRSANQDPLLSGQPLPVKDGFVTLQVNTLYGPEKFAEFLNEERLANPEYASHRARVLAAETLHGILVERLADKKGLELFERANDAGLLAGLLQTADQLLECRQLRERGVWAELPGDGKSPAWRLPAQLGKLSATPMDLRRNAPALGELSLDTALVDAAAARAARAPSTKPADAGTAPLRGMRVLDLSTVFAAPYMGALLADLGAEVIKIEAPGRLDQLRAGGFGYLIDNESGEEPWNRYTTFQTLHRGKRSLVLNLQTDEGRQVLRELVAKSDILIDNFTPRVMKGWGLQYSELARINPKLVMLSNTGYGSTGPWSSYRAQGTTLEATMGLSSYAGYPGGAAAKVGQSYPDFLAAWSGLTLIMAALVHRERTGHGQWVDLGMYQLGAPVIPETLIAVQAGEGDVGCRGNQDWNALLSEVLPAKGHDQWVVVSVADEAQLRRMLAVVAPASAASATPEQARAALATWCAERTPMEATTRLQAAGIAAGPVNDARDLICDPHLIDRGFFEDVEFDYAGKRPLIGRPYVWPGVDVAVRGPAPRFGGDNDHMLRTVLGLDDARVQALRDAAVVTDRPLKLPDLGPEDLQALVKAGSLKEADPHYRDVVAQRRRVPSA